jgi:hypothetical protein
MKGVKWFKWVLCFSLVALCIAPLSSAMAADRTEIRVGAVNSMTGMNAMTAAECRWAYETAVSLSKTWVRNCP